MTATVTGGYDFTYGYPPLTALLTANTRIASFAWPERKTGKAMPRFVKLAATMSGTFTGGTLTVAGKKLVVIEKDDHGKPDPIPSSMLRRMVQSKLLGLFADEEAEEDAKARAGRPTRRSRAATWRRSPPRRCARTRPTATRACTRSSTTCRPGSRGAWWSRRRSRSGRAGGC